MLEKIILLAYVIGHYIFQNNVNYHRCRPRESVYFPRVYFSQGFWPSVKKTLQFFKSEILVKPNQISFLRLSCWKLLSIMSKMSTVSLVGGKIHYSVLARFKGIVLGCLSVLNGFTHSLRSCLNYTVAAKKIAWHKKLDVFFFIKRWRCY